MSSSQLILPLMSTDAISTLTHVVPRVRVIDGVSKSDPLLSRTESISRIRQVVLTSIPLIAADVLSIAASYLLATLCTYAFFGAHYYTGLWNNLFAVCVCHVIVGSFLGLFPASGMNPVRELRAQISSISVSYVLLIALNGLLGQVTKNEILTLVLSFPMIVALAPPARFCTRKSVSSFGWWGEKVIVVGAGTQGRSVYQFLKNLPQRGLKPIGIVDDDFSEYWKLDEQDDIEYLGTTDDLVRICRKQNCHWAIAAVAEMDDDSVRNVLARGSLIANLIVLNTKHSMPTIWVESFDAAGLPGVHIRDRMLLPFQRAAKRLGDIVLSSILLILTSPLLLFISLWVKLESPGPAIYSHQGRIGRGGKKFGARKIRTMVANADQILKKHLAADPKAMEEWKRDQKLRNDPRIIPGIGSFLRRTSLDELPQLWNVLIGDMSLVGPRPIVRNEVDKYKETYPLYERVRPGMTGIWQVSGRNNTSYEDRVRMDHYYIHNWSLWLDYFILLRTVRTVLLREGSY